MMANDLFVVIGVPFEQTLELQRQVLATFAFGMIFAEGRLRGLRPPEVHALVIACLTDVFRYSDQQAVSFSTNLISAASSHSRTPRRPARSFILGSMGIANGSKRRQMN
ncbi:MAG: Imm48 family immunity protein [Terracidiphilus sp.]